MYDLVALFACSLGASLALTPLARVLARRCGLVDRPEPHRKLHSRATPTAGGPVLLLSAATALGLVLWWGGPAIAGVRTVDLLGLLAGASLICAVGVADDFGLLRGRHKLLGQLVAVAVVVAFGVRVDRVALFGGQLELGLLALPFTAFFLLGAINSLNLLDGMDGLLSTVGLILCLALGAMALLTGHAAAACVALALAGALLGFLRYNFPPARIFLGDSGSMLIGLTVGVLAIQSSLKGPATVALAAPAALLTLPIFDTSAAILRRRLTGRSIYCTDHGHLHHCLQRRGLGKRSVLLLVSGLALLTTAGALGSVAFSNEWLALLSAAAVVGVLLATRLFGRTEASLVGQRLIGLVRSLLRGPTGRPSAVETRLLGRMDWKELWQALVAHGQELDLKGVRLDVNAPALNEGYHARWEAGREGGEAAGLWRAEFPLLLGDRVIGSLEVAGGRDGCPIIDKMTALAQLIHEFEATARRMAGAGAAPACPEDIPPHRRPNRPQFVGSASAPLQPSVDAQGTA